jgi:cytochrome P450
MESHTHPPGPKERFPGELLLALQRNPTGLLRRLACDYGDIIYFRIGPFRFFLLNHPDLIKDVLVTHHRNFIKGRAHQQARRVLGEGLLTSEGDFHLRQRRLIQPLFHRHHLEQYGAAISELGEKACERWQAGETLDIAHEMWDLTLRIIARTMFNTTVEAEAEEISLALGELTRMFNPLFLFFADWFERVPNPLSRRYTHARAKLDEKIYRAGGHTGDLPALLLAAQPEGHGGEPLSEQQMRDEALTIFLAGLGTTSYALSRTWYLLSQNPEAEAKFYAELDTVLAGRPPTVEDVSHLVYTRRVLTESMRLYPPSWITDREPIEDYEMRGFRIPAGSIVVLSQWVTHHDPRYFPDPFRFDPDRWIPERESKLPEYAYFPFGGGPRLCIGEQLAWLAAPMLLATIGQQWRLRLSPHHRVDLLPRFSWDPKDTMYMELEKRAAMTNADRTAVA